MRSSFLMYLQSASILRWLCSPLWLLAGARGCQGHVCLIIQQLAWLIHLVLLGFQAQQGRTSANDQVFFKGPLPSHLLLSHWPKQVTWANPESVSGETNQGHRKRERKLLQTIECNQESLFLGCVWIFDLGDGGGRVKKWLQFPRGNSKQFTNI